MKANVYRINDFSLLRINDPNLVQDFYKVKTQMNLDNFQYFTLEDLALTVWDSGDFAHKLNKVYNNDFLFDPILIPSVSSGFYSCEVLLKQGFRWDNIFGLLMSVKNSKTGETYISRIFQINDLYITQNRELIDGSFWFEEFTLKIPKTNDIYLVEVTEILFSDIAFEGTDIGLIFSYPNNFTPLIGEKPIPDFIQSFILFDINHYITFGCKTTENKTLEQSILDYFELPIANILIEHVIMYGTDNLGYKSLRVSNEDNKFLPVNIGLNLLEFNVPGNTDIIIFVSSEISVDGKLMKRESTITTSLLDSINPLVQDMIVLPSTNYPVTVTNEITVQNTIIETPEVTKIITIFQPIFAEQIKNDIIFETKNIVFTNIVNDTYLKLLKSSTDEEQSIINKRTNDNKIYFDLNDFYQINGPTTYELIDKNTNSIIGKGNVSL